MIKGDKLYFGFPIVAIYGEWTHVHSVEQNIQLSQLGVDMLC